MSVGYPTGEIVVPLGSSDPQPLSSDATNRLWNRDNSNASSARCTATAQ